MQDYDIVILGAGISGLSLAHHAARRGLRARVIESADQIGGTLNTHRFGGGTADFWIELGAHTCYNSYTGLIEILEQTGMTDDMLKREKVPFRMLVGDQIRSFPSQINFFELLLSFPRIFFMDKSRESIESYYSRIVGKKNFGKVFQHMFNAVPSQRANDFPADLLFKKRERRKDMLRSFTFRHGIQSVAEKIAAQPGIDVETGNSAVGIAEAAGRFTITTANDNRYESTYLAIATPAVEAARLTRSIDPKLADELSKVSCVEFESTGVAVDKASLALEPVAGIVPSGDSFYSVVSRDTVSDEVSRGFTFHFKPDQRDQQTRLGRIAEVLGIPVGNLRQFANRTNVLPSFRLGHHDWVRKIDESIAGSNLLLTGNYFSGVSIEDCVLRSRSEAARIEPKPA